MEATGAEPDDHGAVGLPYEGLCWMELEGRDFFGDFWREAEHHVVRLVLEDAEGTRRVGVKVEIARASSRCVKPVIFVF